MCVPHVVEADTHALLQSEAGVRKIKKKLEDIGEKSSGISRILIYGLVNFSQGITLYYSLNCKICGRSGFDAISGDILVDRVKHERK